MTLDPAAAWSALLVLLRQHPEADVNAVDDQGLFVALPPALKALGRSERIARSGIELVDEADHGLLISTWLELLGDGVAGAVVRDVGVHERRRHLRFVDLREEHGVVAAVAWLQEQMPGEAPSAPSAVERGRPHLGRIRKDRLAVIVDADADAERMLGRATGALLGTHTRAMVHPEDRDAAVSSWLDLLAEPGSSRRSRLRLAREDGSWLWVDVINHNRLDDPQQACVICDLVDVSAEMALREDVRARERLLRRLAQALPVGLVQVSPTGDIVYTNDRLLEVLGVARRNTLADQLSSLLPADCARTLAAVDAALRTQQDDDLHVRVEAPDGVRVCAVALRPLTDESGQVEGVLGCLTDVTESLELRAQLEQRATYDALTGCLNRAAVLHELDGQVRTSRPGRGCAVLFFDLDGFKAVNDRLGHAAGDAVLRDVASALREAVGAEDAVGRLGGDEFVVVCPGVRSHDDAVRLAEQIRARLDAAAGSSRASTSVAWTDQAAVPAEVLLARADEAMYRAKRSGHGLALSRA